MWGLPYLKLDQTVEMITGINLDSEAKNRFQQKGDRDVWKQFIQDVLEETLKQVLEKFTAGPTIDNIPTTITKQVLEFLVDPQTTKF